MSYSNGLKEKKGSGGRQDVVSSSGKERRHSCELFRPSESRSGGGARRMRGADEFARESGGGHDFFTTRAT